MAMDFLNQLGTSNKREAHPLDNLLSGRVEDPTGELLQRAWEENTKEYTASHGYRWASARTQQTQDRHLAEYRRWMTPFLASSNSAVSVVKEIEPEHNDQFLFPSDHQKLVDLLSRYLLFAAASLKSKQHDETPSVFTLIRRRYSLLFWVRRLCIDPPTKFFIMNGTDSTMHYAVQKFGLRRSMKEKVYFGKDELVQLLDYDMCKTTNMEVAEMHHLAWSLALVCGVRPSSLCRDDFDAERFMRWKNVFITRLMSKQDECIGFVCFVTFTYLKQAMGMKTEDASRKIVKFQLRSPTEPENIPLSPVWRLLTLLLRRGFLEDYNTLSELLQGRHFHIKIKGHALNKPVFIKSTPGGRYLDPNHGALSAQSLTQYMNSRTMELGFPQGSTMYAWRREAGTNIARHAGLEKTRKFMAHRPGSNTFQRWYESELFDLDVFGIAVRETANVDVFSDTTSAAMQRADIVNQQMQRKAIVDAWVEGQPSIKTLAALGNTYKLRLETKRLRRRATKALVEQARQEAIAKYTVGDIARRRKELSNPSKVFAIISDRARTIQIEEEAITSDPDRESEHTEDGLDFNYYADMEEDADVEEAMADEDGGVVNLEALNIEDAPVEDKRSPVMMELVKSFVEFMLEDHSLPGDPRLCPKCQCDPYVTQKEKDRMFPSKSSLQRHLDSKFHNLYCTWLRKMTGEHNEGSSWECPYGCKRLYSQLQGLVNRHILLATTQEFQRNFPEHDNLKRQDGWYRDDWDADYVPKQKRKQNQTYQAKSRGWRTGLAPFSVPVYLESEAYDVFEESTVGLLNGCAVNYGYQVDYDDLKARADDFNRATNNLREIDRRPIQEKLQSLNEEYEGLKKREEAADKRKPVWK